MFPKKVPVSEPTVICVVLKIDLLYEDFMALQLRSGDYSPKAYKYNMIVECATMVNVVIEGTTVLSYKL